MLTSVDIPVTTSSSVITDATSGQAIVNIFGKIITDMRIAAKGNALGIVDTLGVSQRIYGIMQAQTVLETGKDVIQVIRERFAVSVFGIWNLDGANSVDNTDVAFLWKTDPLVAVNVVTATPYFGNIEYKTDGIKQAAFVKAGGILVRETAGITKVIGLGA